MDEAVRSSDVETGDLLREYGVPYGPREMAAFNRLDEIKRVVTETPEVLNDRFRPIWAGAGPTLLAIALARGYREMALFLIESGAPVDTLVYEGSTLLHEAAKGGDPELIRLLLGRGLKLDATDNYSDTPLCDVSSRNKPQSVAALLEAGADVNRQGLNRRTPLYGAVLSDQIDIVRMLLAAGADPTIGDHEGKTPLDVARTRNPEIAQLLEEAVAAKRAVAGN
jgi:ankyrin repeat protein